MWLLYIISLVGNYLENSQGQLGTRKSFLYSSGVPEVSGGGVMGSFYSNHNLCDSSYRDRKIHILVFLGWSQRPSIPSG